MRHLFVILTVLAIVVGVTVSSAQTKKEPAKPLVFQAKMGAVTFDHPKHVARENKDCKTCHDKLFPQDASAPLNFKAGMHKPAEAKKTSCGACHVAGGKSFAASVTANCGKCHQKKAG